MKPEDVYIGAGTGDPETDKASRKLRCKSPGATVSCENNACRHYRDGECCCVSITIGANGMCQELWEEI